MDKVGKHLQVKRRGERFRMRRAQTRFAVLYRRVCALFHIFTFFVVFFKVGKTLFSLDSRENSFVGMKFNSMNRINTLLRLVLGLGLCLRTRTVCHVNRDFTAKGGQVFLCQKETCSNKSLINRAESEQRGTTSTQIQSKARMAWGSVVCICVCTCVIACKSNVHDDVL